MLRMIVGNRAHAHTLEDGTHIATKSQRRLYRDSYGRTRVEFPYPPEAQLDGPASISIYDPLTGKRYSLDPRQQSGAGDRTSEAARSSGTLHVPPPPQPAENVRPKSVREDLGIQTIDGIEAKGTRLTTTIPVAAQGNDKPIVVVSKLDVDQLGVLVLSRNSDPRMGQMGVQHGRWITPRPDQRTCQVPPDYVIRELNKE